MRELRRLDCDLRQAEAGNPSTSAREWMGAWMKGGMDGAGWVDGWVTGEAGACACTCLHCSTCFPLVAHTRPDAAARSLFRPEPNDQKGTRFVGGKEESAWMPNKTHSTTQHDLSRKIEGKQTAGKQHTTIRPCLPFGSGVDLQLHPTTHSPSTWVCPGAGSHHLSTASIKPNQALSAVGPCQARLWISPS